MAAQSGELLPRFAAVLRAEQRGVFHAGVDCVRIGKRRFKMPNSLELPRMLSAVVPLMSSKGFTGFRGGVVHELVALAFGHSLWRGPFARRGAWLCPSFAAIIGSLDNLSEPTAGLRRIQPIRVSRRSLEVVHLPARKVGTTDVPLFALAVRCQDERALSCANQYPYLAHRSLLSSFRVCMNQGDRNLLPRKTHYATPTPQANLAEECVRATGDLSGRALPRSARPCRPGRGRARKGDRGRAHGLRLRRQDTLSARSHQGRKYAESRRRQCKPTRGCRFPERGSQDIQDDGMPPGQVAPSSI